MHLGIVLYPPVVTLSTAFYPLFYLSSIPSSTHLLPVFRSLFYSSSVLFQPVFYLFSIPFFIPSSTCLPSPSLFSFYSLIYSPSTPLLPFFHPLFYPLKYYVSSLYSLPLPPPASHPTLFPFQQIPCPTIVGADLVLNFPAAPIKASNLSFPPPSLETIHAAYPPSPSCPLSSRSSPPATKPAFVTKSASGGYY